MALVTRRNPDTDELESYWDASFIPQKAISNEAYYKGKKLMRTAKYHRVLMGDLAKELGVTSVDVSDTFRGLHEITPQMEAEYREAIMRAERQQPMTSQMSARERIAEVLLAAHMDGDAGDSSDITAYTEEVIAIVREALTDKEAVGTLAQSIADGSGQAVRDSIAREYIGAMLYTAFGEEAGDE